MRRQREGGHPAAQTPRLTRRIDEPPAGKLHEIASCPGCGASYRKGRWTWETAPVGSYEHRCPACEQVEQGLPAGQLSVAGRFVAAHREELEQLVRNVEEREKAEHPLKRIVAVLDEDEGFSVTTTDAKLVQTMGRALQRAYEGELVHPGTTAEKGNLVRVQWTRD